MKKIVVLLILVGSCIGQIKAQDTVYIIREIIRETEKIKKVKDRPGKDIIPEKRNELSLVAGWTPYLSNTFSNNNEIDYFGSYGFRYTRYINERFSTGFTGSYLRAAGFNNGYYDDEIGNSDNRHFIMAMGHFNLNYYNKNNITIYMGASLGLMTVLRNEVNYDYDYLTGVSTRTYEKDRLTIPIADVTAFGIRMKNKSFSPFFEVGFGLEGFFRGGLSVRF